jgi:hypothetical protein
VWDLSIFLNYRLLDCFAKELLKTGAETPELLYNYFDHWAKMMTGDNNILKWTAIDIPGYISAKKKADALMKLMIPRE